MTPKEKAIELVEQFSSVLMHDEVYEDSIKCALIAVDFAKEFITGDLSEAFDKFLYLQDIKEEIEKL
jgi:hypothetical protein